MDKLEPRARRAVIPNAGDLGMAVPQTLHSTNPTCAYHFQNASERTHSAVGIHDRADDERQASRCCLTFWKDCGNRWQCMMGDRGRYGHCQ